MTEAPGYSGKPVAAKLGLKPGMAVLVTGIEVDYAALVGPLPEGLRLADDKDTGGVVLFHLFVTERALLAEKLAAWRLRMAPDAAIWISWPKKSAKVPTDITEDVIRAVALPMGFVDIKVCAVSEIWSGLKLVIRKSER